jgi:hypothetical protein
MVNNVRRLEHHQRVERGVMRCGSVSSLHPPAVPLSFEVSFSLTVQLSRKPQSPRLWVIARHDTDAGAAHARRPGDRCLADARGCAGHQAGLFSHAISARRGRPPQEGGER